MIRKITLLLFFCSTFRAAIGQENLSQNAQETAYGEAKKLVERATIQLKAGNSRFADSLVRKSISIFPTTDVYEYAKEIMRASDIRHGNELMDLNFKRLQGMQVERIATPFTTVDRKFFSMQGEFVVKYSMMKKVTMLHEHAVHILKTNKGLGNHESIGKAYQRVVENRIEYKIKTFDGPLVNMVTGGETHTLADDMYYKPRMIEQFQFRMEYYMFFNKHKEALTYISDRPEKGFIKKELYEQYLVLVLADMGEYDKALAAAKGLDKDIRDNFIGIVKLKKGDLDLPASFVKNKFEPRNPAPAMFANMEMMGLPNMGNGATELPAALNDHGLYLMIRKDYAGAAEKFKAAIKARGGVLFFGFSADEYPWKIYKNLGDAYTAMKEFTKARDSYRISLLYYPEYQAASDAMDKMEQLYAAEQSLDKTGPVITITSPASRGLKITASGKDIMVRGFAQDPSGIKEVTINGTKAYSQESGNFWNNVVLAENVSAITVTATDKAGNAGTAKFTLERSNTEPIAVAGAAEPKNYCLLIAAQNYADNAIPSLENPVGDALKLKIIFKEKYKFEESDIVTLLNPSNNDIKRQLIELSTRVQPEDNLIIFYAGHGIWSEKEKKGFWLMTDAKFSDQSSWLPNKEVLDLISKVPAQHTLLITDACFSGSVFRTRGLGANASAALKELDSKVSRVAITSGNDTEVPDESVFMKYLVKALNDNRDSYMTAQKLFITKILEAVMTETKTQPRYGTLESAGHVGGDFIFVKK
ncbi:MAG TPA: caspase family protein [Sphingobacteriaceae bacterium]